MRSRRLQLIKRLDDFCKGDISQRDLILMGYPEDSLLKNVVELKISALKRKSKGENPYILLNPYENILLGEWYCSQGQVDLGLSHLRHSLIGLIRNNAPLDAITLGITLYSGYSGVKTLSAGATPESLKKVSDALNLIGQIAKGNFGASDDVKKHAQEWLENIESNVIHQSMEITEEATKEVTEETKEEKKQDKKQISLIALVTLAKFYYMNGVNQDIPKAMSFYQRAAVLGDRVAQRKLADILYFGYDPEVGYPPYVEQDFVKAAQLYEIFKNTDREVQGQLADLYFRGVGVEFNLDKGIEYFRGYLKWCEEKYAFVRDIVRDINDGINLIESNPSKAAQLLGKAKSRLYNSSDLIAIINGLLNVLKRNNPNDVSIAVSSLERNANDNYNRLKLLNEYMQSPTREPHNLYVSTNEFKFSYADGTLYLQLMSDLIAYASKFENPDSEIEKWKIKMNDDEHNQIVEKSKKIKEARTQIASLSEGKEEEKTDNIINLWREYSDDLFKDNNLINVYKIAPTIIDLTRKLECDPNLIKQNFAVLFSVDALKNTTFVDRVQAEQEIHSLCNAFDKKMQLEMLDRSLSSLGVRYFNEFLKFEELIKKGVKITDRGLQDKVRGKLKEEPFPNSMNYYWRGLHEESCGEYDKAIKLYIRAIALGDERQPRGDEHGQLLASIQLMRVAVKLKDKSEIDKNFDYGVEIAIALAGKVRLITILKEEAANAGSIELLTVFDKLIEDHRFDDIFDISVKQDLRLLRFEMASRFCANTQIHHLFLQMFAADEYIVKKFDEDEDIEDIKVTQYYKEMTESKTFTTNQYVLFALEIAKVHLSRESAINKALEWYKVACSLSGEKINEITDQEALRKAVTNLAERIRVKSIPIPTPTPKDKQPSTIRGLDDEDLENKEMKLPTLGDTKVSPSAAPVSTTTTSSFSSTPPTPTAAPTTAAPTTAAPTTAAPTTAAPTTAAATTTAAPTATSSTSTSSTVSLSMFAAPKSFYALNNLIRNILTDYIHLETRIIPKPEIYINYIKQLNDYITEMCKLPDLSEEVVRSTLRNISKSQEYVMHIITVGIARSKNNVYDEQHFIDAFQQINDMNRQIQNMGLQIQKKMEICKVKLKDINQSKEFDISTLPVRILSRLKESALESLRANKNGIVEYKLVVLYAVLLTPKDREKFQKELSKEISNYGYRATDVNEVMSKINEEIEALSKKRTLRPSR